MADASRSAGRLPGRDAAQHFFVAPLVSETFTKLLFATMWCSFGLLHLHRIREITAYAGMTPHDVTFDHRAGLVVGRAGGALVASVTGVGVDI